MFLTGKQFIGVDLRVKYDLDETSDDKPTMNVDDIFILLYHHWVLCVRIDMQICNRKRTYSACASHITDGLHNSSPFNYSSGK